MENPSNWFPTFNLGMDDVQVMYANASLTPDVAPVPELIAALALNLMPLTNDYVN